MTLFDRWRMRGARGVVLPPAAKETLAGVDAIVLRPAPVAAADVVFPVAPAVSPAVVLPDAPATTLGQAVAEQLAIGNGLEDQGLLNAAMDHYLQAIRLAPDSGNAHLNRGNVLTLQGDLPAALAAYETACRCQPGHAAAYLNIGNVLMRLKRWDAALTAYAQATTLQSGMIDAAVGQAAALDELQQPARAALAYQEVLSRAPEYAEIHGNLGVVLARLGRYQEALVSLQQCVALRPDYARGHLQLANHLKDLGRFEDAIAEYEQAIACDPQDADLRSSRLFTAHYAVEEPEAALAAAIDYGKLVAARAQPFRQWPNQPDPERLLRIGLVSGDFRQHPVGDFLDAVLHAVHADLASRIDLIGYANHDADDAMTRRLASACSTWRVVTALSDAALVDQIQQDRIDILIDLSGHTGFSRLPVFAWKAAPVQATWLGYFSTTGVAAIDYLIADPVTLPVAEERHFTETIWRLPHTRLCFTPSEASLAPGSLPALQKGHVTFGCFNHLSKMNDEVVRVWSAVLATIPGSILFLKSPPLGDAGIRHQTSERFARHGVEPSQLRFEGLSSKAAYLEAYHQVDIALDPFPYPGGATTMEALWMGVPVMTLAGERFLARQGVGLLTNAGLAAWIADDTDDYIARCAAMASDLPALARLRSGLRQQLLASPVCDAGRFAGDLSEALRKMWRRWCRLQGQSAED